MHIYNTINVALIFVGEHALRNIIPVLEKSSRYNIVGLYFRTHNKEIISKFSNYTIYSKYSDVMRDNSVDCIYMSSTNDSHFKYSYEALINYKHVICEKPLATNYTDMIKLLNCSLSVKKCIFEAFMFEYHKQFVELQKLVNNHKIEKVITITSRFGYPHLDFNNIRYKKKLGGGAFFDSACYLIKAVFLLLGDDYISAKVNIIKENGFEVDIGGNCLITFKSGQSAFLDWGMGRAYSNELNIWTEQSTIKADRFFSKPESVDTNILITQSNGLVSTINVPGMNHFDAMFNEFFNIINSGNKYNEYLVKLKAYQKFFFSIYKVSSVKSM